MKHNKLIPFGNFWMNSEELQGMVTTITDKEEGYVYFELPDSVYGFKSAKITYPDLVIEERVGFTDKEMAELINIIKRNYSFLIEIAKEGKIYA